MKRLIVILALLLPAAAGPPEPKPDPVLVRATVDAVGAAMKAIVRFGK